MLLLLLGMFRICAVNNIFRDKISEIFQDKEGKKLLKEVKGWIKEVGTGLMNCLRYDRMGYWRKPRDTKLTQQNLNYIVDTEDAISVEKFQAALNAIV